MACTDGVVSAYAANEAELRAALARHEPVIRLTSSPMALRRELLIDRNLTLQIDLRVIDAQGGRHANIRIEADRRSRVRPPSLGLSHAQLRLSPGKLARTRKVSVAPPAQRARHSHQLLILQPGVGREKVKNSYTGKCLELWIHFY